MMRKRPQDENQQGTIMIKTTPLSLLGIASFAIIASACTPVVDKYIPNPAIERRDCSDCDMNMFRSDDSGTLYSAISKVQPLLSSAPADIRPLFFQGRGIDMNGNLLLTDNMFWNLVFVSNSARQTYQYQMATDGRIDVEISNHETIADFLLGVNLLSDIFNAAPFPASTTLDDLLAASLADSPTVMAAVTTSSAYNASGFGLGVETYDFDGTILPVGAYYAESVSEDIATEVTYDANGIEAIIIDESLWTIVDFPAEQRPYGSQPKSEWIQTHYGEVSRSNYFSARKTFPLTLSGALK
jgi:hypothetical protein